MFAASASFGQTEEKFDYTLSIIGIANSIELFAGEVGKGGAMAVSEIYEQEDTEEEVK